MSRNTYVGSQKNYIYIAYDCYYFRHLNNVCGLNYFIFLTVCLSCPVVNPQLYTVTCHCSNCNCSFDCWSSYFSSRAGYPVSHIWHDSGGRRPIWRIAPDNSGHMLDFSGGGVFLHRWNHLRDGNDRSQNTHPLVRICSANNLTSIQTPCQGIVLP